MESLKATKARDITKESVTEAETLVVNGVSVSKPAEHPMQRGSAARRSRNQTGWKPVRHIECLYGRSRYLHGRRERD
jgi:hypothetical protein